MFSHFSPATFFKNKKNTNTKIGSRTILAKLQLHIFPAYIQINIFQCSFLAMNSILVAIIPMNSGSTLIFCS